jgi:signal transduction histidine kinase
MGLKFISSLRFRLVALVLLAALPALALTVYTGYEQRELAANTVNQEALRLARFAASNQEVVINNTRAFLVATAHMPNIYELRPAECDSLFSHLLDTHYPYYSGFYVADREGNLLCNAPQHEVPGIGNCEHYQRLAKEGEFRVSTYHFCPKSGEPVISVGFPVLDLNDEFIGVVNVGIDLEWFNEFAVESEMLPGSTLSVLDQRGIILVHYPDPENWVGRKMPEQELYAKMIAEGEGTTESWGADGQQRLYAFTPLWSTEGNVFLVISTPSNMAYADVDQSTRRNLFLLLLATILAGAAAWLLGELFVVRQTNRLIRATEQISSGDLEARADLGNQHGEFGKLALAFNQMAEKLQKRERERDEAEAEIRAYADDLERMNRDLKQFAYVASHDIQEPLRKVQIFADLLNRRYSYDLDDRGREYLTRMQDAAGRMQQLLYDLLSFSRLTTRPKKFADVDLNAVLVDVVADLDMKIEASNAVVEIGDLPIIEGDASLIRLLFDNLIGNGIKFAKQDERPIIQISCLNGLDSPMDDNNQCEIHIQDNGIGFDIKYLDRIFLPFERLHARDNYEGMGMGLTICRRIVESHRGNITATSIPGKGSTFIVSLPYRHSGEENGS